MILTRAEEREGTVKVVLVNVGQGNAVLVPDLLVGTEHHKQEASVSIRNLLRVPLSTQLLINLATDRRSNGSSGSKTTSQRQVHTGGEVRVNEAAGVTNNAGVGERVGGGAVGVVGGGLDVGHELALTNELLKIGGELVEGGMVQAGGVKALFLLPVGLDLLVDDGSDGD